MSAEFGGSWWGQRWIETLERLSTAWQNRLPRGRDYARKGHVISLSVSPGKIAARVQGSRSKPYVTTIEVPALRSSDWDQVIETLASEARFPAQLLIGIMPADIDDMFAEHNVNLFPARNSEMLGSCTCPDKARPCKHIAAVHYAFGQALDRDPFLLFHVRGADRDRLIEGFNRAWFGEEHEADEDTHGTNGSDTAIEVEPLSADNFTRAAEDIEEMSFAPFVNDSSLLILDRLGAPRSWSVPIAIEDLLGPVFTEATKLARSVAAAGFDDSERRQTQGEDETSSARADDPFTALALVDEDDDDDGYDAARPRATFVLPASLGAVNKRIAKAPAPTPEPVAPTPTRVRVRKAAAPQRRTRDESPSRASESGPQRKTRAPIAPPADFVPTPDVGSSAVLVHRGHAGTGGPAIVRRRGKGGIQIEQAEAPQDNTAQVADLKELACAALEEGRETDALRAASQVWASEPSIDTFMLLMAAADVADRKEETIQSESARLLLRAREKNFELSTPDALVLLCAGELKLVADHVFSLGKRSWRDDGPAAPVLLYAMRVLVGSQRIPGGSHLSRLLREAGARKGEFRVDVGSLGSWLQWAATEHPPPPTVHERLHRICRELSSWALASASAIGGPEQAARWVCAVAETFAIAKIDGGAMPYLASIQDQVAKKKRLVEAFEAAVADSSVIA